MAIGTTARRCLACTFYTLLLFATSGCSSLGLSVWPSQFQLLKKTKQFAQASPLPSGVANELSKLDVQDYFVEPGDRILIEAVDLDSSIGSLGDQKVQVDGSIDLGKYGRIRVSGMTVEQIEVAIQQHLALQGDSEGMNVQLVESNSAEIYVLGEVGSPAAYPIDGHEHVLDLILRAGGLTSKASPCDIVLVRPTTEGACRVVLPVCYRQITQLGDVTTNYQLQPGDRIIVGSRSFLEELSFWKQANSCDRCCRSCCVECEPAQVNYGRRFAFNPIQLPMSKPVEQSSAPSTPKVDPALGTSQSEPQEVETFERPSLESDEKMFLPPLKSNTVPKQ